MRRISWLLILAVAGGCKSVEVAVDHPMLAVHVTAKFEARDRAPAAPREAVRVALNDLSALRK